MAPPGPVIAYTPSASLMGASSWPQAGRTVAIVATKPSNNARMVEPPFADAGVTRGKGPATGDYSRLLDSAIPHDHIEVDHGLEVGAVTDPVVHDVAVLRHLLRPPRVVPGDDRP